ncbi:ATP-dependent DNA helicase 2 subunit 1-like [Lucilia cuprina]|uniref:ATP-dependent DNA helicase 2 subunit 1 n=1 Tax=Lucilia cuprina TaxID=7375 RepID=UPI001F068431|nr:ATP-dependent DNA helicase 2 subunit 1 [Lucilia cuprina]XP_046805902.1 ATP-dependent DNA helicase 2 subunit 1-like [Lucilia cuprina]
MSSWNPEFEISISDSEDEGDQLQKKFSGRESIIFVIDANLYNRSELLDNALVILRRAFLSGLLVNDRDLIGLIFANTKHSPEPHEPNCLDDIIMPEKCAVFLPPRQLNTAIVQMFLRFVETAPTQFDEIYGVAPEDEGCNFSHMLRLCMDLVQHCNYLIDNTTIVYLTDIELPHPHDSECYRQVLQKAADLKGKDVEFHLIPMIDIFNYDLFYKEFICLIQDTDIDCFEPTDPKRLREMLANRKFKQHYVRRSLGHFKFTLGPNLVLSAQYFNYYQKGKKPQKVLLQRTDSAVVRKHRITQVRKQDKEMDAAEVKDVNIKNAWYEINLGSEKMRLSYEQVNRVRNLHPPGMSLLGFKPRSSLASAIYCKTANFMYPDDIHIEGSKRLFRALWEKCIEKEKIAICLFMCRRKSMPRYVALVPVEKNTDSETHEAIMLNDGFKIVYLCCATYIRSFNLSDWNTPDNDANDDGLQVCEKLMKKFRLDYKPDILYDPDLDQLQSKLLSLAFNVSYETLGSQYFPNPDIQTQRIQKLLPTFEEVFGTEIPEVSKRSSDKTSGSSNIAKKPKLSADFDVKNEAYIKEMIKNKSLNSCTKDQLMEILSTHFNKKAPKTIKKQDLIDIIYNL